MGSRSNADVRINPTMYCHRALPIVAGIFLSGLLEVGLSAQGPAALRQPLSEETIDNLIASARPDAPATLTLANREIVVLRAAILGRSSAERVEAVRTALRDDIEAAAEPGVTSRSLGTASIISVGGRDTIAILPADADQLIGETVEGKTAAAVDRLRVALSEIAEARRPRLLAWGITMALLATVVLAAALWGLGRIYRSATAAADLAARRLARSAIADEIVRGVGLLQFAARLVKLAVVAASVFVAYSWLTFVLQRFPYTRAWGESLRSFLIDRLAWLGQGILAALPDLFTIVLIVLLTRVAVRIVNLCFHAIAEGRIQVPGTYPETALTTAKLVSGLLWVMAIVVAYPYVPGSSTEAFKGISVMVGLMFSIGSSGIATQIMSGFTLTYSRALRVGNFVAIGDMEGTVTQTGILSTKIRTLERHEITIPNAVLIAGTVTNFSPLAGDSTYASTSVTIGYDAPWRQVEALLIASAKKTAGIRTDPPPVVRQTALEDFFVRYKLLVSLDVPSDRGRVFNELHANIQDTFNEHGVQIMSPHYESDPGAPKVVPPNRWFPAPAAKEPARRS